jgi:hypothetical protein
MQMHGIFAAVKMHYCILLIIAVMDILGIRKWYILLCIGEMPSLSDEADA